MKKLLLTVLVLCLALSATTLAEGKLTVTKKNLIIFTDDDSGYFFAKVENTGDTPIGVGDGKLVGFSADDEIILSESYVTTYPSYVVLRPGEHLYLSEYIWDSALKDNAVADYKFSLGTYDRAEDYFELPCEAVMALEGADSYDNYIYVTFTNTNEDPMTDFCVVFVLTDAEDNLIFVDAESYDDLTVHPGSTVTVRCYIGYSLMEYYAEHGIVPTQADAMVCYAMP